MVKALIFDNYQVLFQPPITAEAHINTRGQIAQMLDIPIAELVVQVYDGDLSRQAYLGKITTLEFWQNLFKQYHKTVPAIDLMQLDRCFWWGNESPSYNKTLMQYIQTQKSHYKTALLSNAWDNIFLDWQAAGANLPAVFDEAFISCEVNCKKPDTSIFELALKRLDLQANEAIFIDDNIKNITAAHNLGLGTVRFLNAEQAIQDINTLLERDN